jgi:hypothetical protein
VDEKFVVGIRIMRVLSATIEVTAAFLLLRMSDIPSMVRLNSLLGLVGPLIFITVSALGLAGTFGTVHWSKFLMILGGVALVVVGTR